jgi:hypothetical protein
MHYFENKAGVVDFVNTKLAISKVILLTPCMEFEKICGQIASLEVL